MVGVVAKAPGKLKDIWGDAATWHPSPTTVVIVVPPQTVARTNPPTHGSDAPNSDLTMTTAKTNEELRTLEGLLLRKKNEQEVLDGWPAPTIYTVEEAALESNQCEDSTIESTPTSTLETQIRRIRRRSQTSSLVQETKETIPPPIGTGARSGATRASWFQSRAPAGIPGRRKKGTRQ